MGEPQEQSIKLGDPFKRIASLEARLSAAEEALRPFANDGNWFHNYDGAGIIFRNGHGESAQRQAIQAAKEALATASGEGEAGEEEARVAQSPATIRADVSAPSRRGAKERPMINGRSRPGTPPRASSSSAEPPGVVLSRAEAYLLTGQYGARNQNEAIGRLRVLLDRKGDNS